MNIHRKAEKGKMEIKTVLGKVIFNYQYLSGLWKQPDAVRRSKMVNIFSVQERNGSPQLGGVSSCTPLIHTDELAA